MDEPPQFTGREQIIRDVERHQESAFELAGAGDINDAIAAVKAMGPALDNPKLSKDELTQVERMIIMTSRHVVSAAADRLNLPVSFDPKSDEEE